MNKEYFIELAGYNLWANKLVCSWLSTLSDEQLNLTIVSSFPSIKETALHILSAEDIWYQRLNNSAHTLWLADTFQGNGEKLITLWDESSSKLHTFCININDEELTNYQFFKRLNGEEKKMKLYEMLAHVFNHSTYHRGQLVTMLRQVGFENVTSTDLLTFYINKKGY